MDGAFRPLHLVDGHLPIEDYGLIGDGRAAALVGRDGSVPWLCAPRFDSPPVFCALLDHRRGGAFRLRPDGLAESRQYYHGDTGGLVTELRTGTGLLRVTDTLTLIEGADLAGPATARGELLRRLEVPHGSVTVELDVDPRGEVTVRRDGGGWRLHCDRWPDLVLRFAVTRPATRVPTARETHRDPVRARYTAGTAGGRALPDYTDEDGVDPDRRTETYARIDLTVDNWRWSGVRFVLRSGKALAADRTEVALHFHPVPHSAFPDIDPPTPNVLRLGLGPDRIGLGLNLNTAGDPFALARGELSLGLAPQDLSPYARLLRDILDGDPTLSIRGDEAEESWRIVEPVLESWQRDEVPMLTYPAGSAGPEPAP